LSVALLVESPKTDTFGNKRPLTQSVWTAVRPFTPFISPLLASLRVCVRGSFSCLNAFFGHGNPAHPQKFGSIQGETYV
jgi:hypothetical protein